jgi:hypothetical protein
LLLQTSYFFKQDARVHDDAIADNRSTVRRQDSAGQQMKCETALTHHDGVAGVISTLIAHDVLDTTAK